jgi:urease accessory protein
MPGELVIKTKLGSLQDTEGNMQELDWVSLEWYETSKRILRKKTKAGRDISLRFLQENAILTEGDILYNDGKVLIVVEVLPCDCILIEPKNMFEMASLCYEIGNKHLPLFFENNTLLVPFEQPLYTLLLAQGHNATRENRKLLNQLRTTVSAHGHGNTSIFNRIMKMTTSNGE